MSEEIELNSFKEKLEQIKNIDENNVEFWYARDLQEILGYSQWRRFEETIERARETCKLSNINISLHFANVGKTLAMPNFATKEINDYKLTRYACYLIAQNGDPRKKEIAMAQTYFAVQTRKQEIIEDRNKELSDDQQRVFLREDIKKQNRILSGVAKNAGVLESFDYANFQNAGYKGLYNGRTKKDIANLKGLNDKKDILDHMGNEELGANIFRITQTSAKIQRENIIGKEKATATHYEVGKKVRETIKEIGGNMPETLPFCDDIKKIERKLIKEKKITEKQKIKKIK